MDMNEVSRLEKGRTVVVRETFEGLPVGSTGRIVENTGFEVRVRYDIGVIISTSVGNAVKYLRLV